MPSPSELTYDEIRQLYEEYMKTEGKTLKDFLIEKGIVKSESDYEVMRRKFKMIEKMIEKGEMDKPQSSDDVEGKLRLLAKDNVLREILKTTTRESVNTIKWKYILGDKLWRVYADYAARRGWDVSKIHEHPIDQVFAEALRKAEAYDELAERVRQLEALVSYYESEYSPLEHAKNVAKLVSQSLLALATLRRLGFKIRRDSDVVKLYNRLINTYAKLPLAVEVGNG